MTPDESLRKLVQPAVWQIFQKYFPEALQYTSSDSSCEECLVTIISILTFLFKKRPLMELILFHIFRKGLMS